MKHLPLDAALELPFADRKIDDRKMALPADRLDSRDRPASLIDDPQSSERPNHVPCDFVRILISLLHFSVINFSVERFDQSKYRKSTQANRAW
ncbi:MAG: hypothetical protein WD066_09760 [Planctomycetaceae bacterium]